MIQCATVREPCNLRKTLRSGPVIQTRLCSERWPQLTPKPSDSTTRSEPRNKRLKLRKRPATTVWCPISKEASPPIARINQSAADSEVQIAFAHGIRQKTSI